MKIFVSGQLREKEHVRHVYQMLIQRGHEVTHDWTRTDNFRGSYGADKREAGQRAAHDVDGVMKAERYIILTDNSRCGKGMYVELGVALARARSGEPIEIAIVGPMNHESIFYYHPLACHFSNIEEYLDHLDGSSPGDQSDWHSRREGNVRQLGKPRNARTLRVNR